MITTKTSTELAEMSYQELNDYTFEHFLNSYFYKDWQNENPQNHLEIIFSPKCNLKCSYCYMNKYSSKTFPDHMFDAQLSIENSIKILDWLGKNNCAPPIEIFSGELFAQSGGYDLMEAFLNFFEKHPNYKRPPYIIVPTNGTFLHSESLTDKIEEYMEKFKSYNCPLILSFSTDGLLLEENVRNYKFDLDLDESLNLPRDQNYYDKMFSFMVKHRMCVHPMVYSKDAHKWIDNFNWFMEMYEKYNLPWWNLYLLEVRNYDWTKQNVEDFSKFLEYLMDYAWEKLEHNKDLYIDWLTTGPGQNDKICAGFNILFNTFAKSATGSRCAIQNQLTIRASDLTVFPCHRLMYPGLEIGTYDENFHFNSKQTELGIGIFSFDPMEQNVCATCAIKHLCPTQCFGSQFETNKDMFTPIPSVCYLNFMKVKTILKKLDELDLVERFASALKGDERAELWQFYNNEIKE